MTKSELICPLCFSPNTAKYLMKDNFSINICKECTNAWTAPSPSTINYESLDFHKLEISEKDNSPKSIEKLPKQWRSAIDQQIKFIKKHVATDASVLEIGTGEGIFLNELSKHRYRTFGIEPSKEAALRAEKLGLDIIQGYFPNDKLKNRKFDLVIMSQVLEHIENPLKVFEDIKEILSENGKIMLVQTNYKGIMPKIFRGKWYAWVPEQHFWHFTPRGILEMAKKQGFKELDCEYSSLVHYHDNFSVKNIIMFFAVQFVNLFPSRMKDQFHILLTRNN